MGRDFTYDQYKNNENDIQSTINQRHFSDIDKFIADNGLEKYEGTSINGTPMTRQAMYAVAHLGGNGGLRSYLTSGGADDRADELGTRLSDYARLHHGGPTMAAETQLREGSLKDFSLKSEESAERFGRSPRNG